MIKRYPTAIAEGVLSETCSGQNFDGQSIVERTDAQTGHTVYFVESEAFQGRYYSLCQRAHGWYFSGDDRLAAKYIAKVEAMLQARCAVAA